MTVQRYTRPITDDDKSLMLEALEGNQWDPKTSDLRFPLEIREGQVETDAARYVRVVLKKRLGIAQSIRITPSPDPVNCTFGGALGDPQLIMLK